MINWFSQIAAVARFGVLSMPQRRGSVAAALFGIVGVVGVLVGVLSMAAGFKRTMMASSSPDAAIVLRSGANDEMSSGLERDETRLLAEAPGVAKGTEGPLASGELFVIISLPKRSTGTDANVPFRGVQSSAFNVRGNIKLIEGRRFEPGRNEIMVGVGAAREFKGLDVGQKLRIGQNEWDVVGIFTAGGGMPESELWTDAAVLQPAYHRGDSYQVVHAKLSSPKAFQEFKDSLTANPQLNTRVTRQTEFYAEQSTMMTGLITRIGVVIAAL